MDINSLYTNIPQEEGIAIVCKTYETFCGNKLPIPAHFLREMLRIILKENSFHFNGKNHLQTHGTPMGTKWQYLANILLIELTLQRGNLINTSHYSNKDSATGVIQITF